ncbi:MAG TPA: hypothetical protein PLP14_10615 [Chitinophagaceae bacterium]|nr:hypothetical protein [Chitinophagaceae bacterium]
MKTVLKGILYLILLLIVLVIGFVTWLNFSDLPSYPVAMTEELKNLKVEVDSTSVARGERLASMLCVKCHMGEGNKMVGKELADLPKEFGKIHAYNITQDKELGIGTWTDGEIAYFLKTGIRRDGTYAPPYMPKFPLMADVDLHAIIAWLHSDRPNVQAAAVKQEKNDPNLLIRFLCRVAMKPLPLQASPIPAPDSNNQVALGRYLTTGALGCFQCHSENFKTNNEIEPEKSVGFFGGGNPMLDMEGNVVNSMNITPDPESGIGKYSEYEFMTLLHTGRRPDGKMVRYPMEPYPMLNEKELKAIYAYLKTVPPLHNQN